MDSESQKEALRALLEKQAQLSKTLQELSNEIKDLSLQIVEEGDVAGTSTYVPPPLPPMIPKASIPPKISAVPLPPPLPPVIPAKKVPRDPIEVKVGVYWLTPIGVILLLTGLVFFVQQAYQIFGLTPISRFGILFGTSLICLGGSLWLEKWRPALRIFSRVLISGCFAALYYLVYASHYVKNFSFVESPWLSLLGLIVVAVTFVGFAERRASQTMAMFGFGFAFYAAAIGPMASFTLCANIILAVGAIVLMLRKRWFSLPFLALVASYLSYIYWQRPFISPDCRVSMAQGALFLVVYWVIFTASVFLEGQAPRLSSILLFSFNNLFFLIAASYQQEAYFDEISITLGVIVLVSGLLLRLIPNGTSWLDTFLAEGLAIVSIGLIGHFNGDKRCLIFSLLSFLLMAANLKNRSKVIHFASYVSAVLATFFIFEIIPHRPIATLFGVWLFMFFNTAISNKRAGEGSNWNWSTAFFSLLASLAGIFFCLSVSKNSDVQSALLFTYPLVIITLIPLHQSSELSWLSQLSILPAFLTALDRHPWYIHSPVWLAWAPPVLLGVCAWTTYRWLRPVIGSFLELFVIAYGYMTVALILSKISHVVAVDYRLLSATFAGILICLLGRSYKLIVRCAWVLVAAAFVFWSPCHYIWGNLAFVAALIFQIYALKFLPEGALSKWWHGVAQLILCISLWMQVRYLTIHYHGTHVANWGLLAFVLLTVGMLFRVRLYRYFGLFIIAVSLLRIVFHDVWKLAIFYRITSLIALGLLMILLGFLYNKYQDRIKQWL